MTFEQAQEAFQRVLSDHWRRQVQRLTGADAEALADLATQEIRYGLLAGDPRADNLRAHTEAQLVALLATVSIVEARELDATLRRILEIGREVLVTALQIVAKGALPIA
jgi:hypothetical protein